MNDTISLCAHGNLVKLSCDKCSNEHRMNYIESLAKHASEGVEKCFEKMESQNNDYAYLLNKMSERIEKLELQNIEHQIKRIADLEIWVRNQADIVNRIERDETLINLIHKQKEKINILQNQNATFNAKLNLLLDTSVNKYMLENDSKKANEKFELLENKINAISNISDAIKRSVSIMQNDDGARPYKCPVCLGERRIQVFEQLYSFKMEIDSLGRLFIKCDSCEGKGIVWG